MLYCKGNYQLNTDVSYGDKSITHRALILSSVANAPSVITNASVCADTLATADCLSRLGAGVVRDGTTFYVMPITKPNTNVVLDCKNSGTSARLLAGLVCGLGIRATFVGDESLIKRPMKRLTSLLEQMGAKFSFPTGCLFQTEGGALVGRQFDLKVASAQIKSALLIAGLFADGTTTVSQPTCRDHTEIMLDQMQANINVEGNKIAVKSSNLVATDILVPNDFSTASFLIAIGLKNGCTLPNVGVNPTRTGLVEVLDRALSTVVLLAPEAMPSSLDLSEALIRPAADVVAAEWV